MGNALKEVRESKGITQKFVASQLDISRQHYHTIENHKNYVPKITHAYQLANILDTPVEELFPNINLKL